MNKQEGVNRCENRNLSIVWTDPQKTQITLFHDYFLLYLLSISLSFRAIIGLLPIGGYTKKQGCQVLFGRAHRTKESLRLAHLHLPF